MKTNLEKILVAEISEKTMELARPLVIIESFVISTEMREIYRCL